MEASGEEGTGSGGFCGRRGLCAGCGLQEPARPEAHTEVSGSMAEMVAAPSATPPPSWQVVGC